MEALQKLYDFRDVELPEALFALAWDPGAVEQAVEDVRVRFLTIHEAADTVTPGDFAVFRLPAQGEQKEKTVQVNVGKHFYDAAFEDSLAGLEIGAEVTMPTREGNRKGVLVSLKRRKLPEISDELIARMELEGANTVDAYREMVKQKMLAREKQKKCNALRTVVLKAVCKHSAFGSLDTLVEEKLADYDTQLREIAQQNGMTYEELKNMNTPAQYDTPEKKAAYWKERAEGDVKIDLISRAYTEAEGKVFSHEDYEAECRELLSMGRTQEQLDRLFSYETFLKSAPKEYYCKGILAYFDNRFKVVEPV